MTTEKQIEANRANAMKSTGPTSSEGKERSAQNAISHGLTAKKVALKGENTEEYEAFLEDVTRYFQPQGAIENRLVKLIVAEMWRLERFAKFESVLRTPRERESENDAACQHIITIMQSGFSDNLIRYEAHSRRGLLTLLRQLDELIKRRKEAEDPH